MAGAGADGPTHGMSEPTLAQRLGYPADAKLLIINADDLGSCHSANVGVFECLATGTVTSATLMVPCPWAREASSRYRGEDVGVHLTAQRRVRALPLGPHHPRPVAARRRRRLPEHGRGRLGPRRPRRGAPRVPGPDRAGHPLGLRRQPPRRPHGHAAAAARVLRRLSGPGRSSSGCRCAWSAPAMERYVGFPARAVAAEAGAVFTDHFRFVGRRRARARRSRRTSPRCGPGVTEMHLHPAVDSAELRSLATDDWEARVDDYRDDLQGGLGPPLPRRGGRDPHRLPPPARAGAGRRLIR